MKRAAQSETKLRELLAHGALPASACGNALRRLVAPLITGGVLTWQRGGAGQRLAVADPTRLSEFIAHAYPQSPIEAAAFPSSRVAGVARYRDSKAVANDVPEIVSVRAYADGLVRCEGNPMPASSHTAQYGVFSFLRKDDDRHSLHGACALVESPALFTACEMLRLSTPLILYGHGRISKRLVNWLALQNDPAFTLLHLPDYDPVGLNEFLRLRNGLGNRVQLHTPNDLAQRFKRFGKRELLSKPNSQYMLAKLRSSKCAEVLAIVELIDRHNAGLEQEALLL